MNRSILEFKPKGDPNAPTYAPQRDLAYLFPPFMKEAVLGMDAVNWRDYFKEWLEQTGTTEYDLADGIKCYADAIQLFTGDATITQPVDALERSGFLALPKPVILTIYARMGEVITAGFFIAKRDITRKDHLSPNIADLADLLGAARLMAERLTGKSKDIPPVTEQRAAKAEALVRVLEEQLGKITEQLDAASQLTAALQEGTKVKTAMLETALVTARQERDVQVNKAAHYYNDLIDFRRCSIGQIFYWRLRLFFGYFVPLSPLCQEDT